MADVFVSYSRANRDRVAGVSDGLAATGYSVWWDQQLLPSDDYAMLIEREIDAARCVVVAWSQTARQSLWVRAEANEALDKGKLVQINLDGARLPLPFTMLHFLDFRRWRGERQGSPWSELDGRVGGMLRGETAEPVEGPALQGFGKTALLGWAAIALAAVIAIAVAMAASGEIAPATFSALTMGAVALAAILMALAAFILVRISLASRR
ncbi:MAG: hypothetical protein QOJ53_1845 [Sphingomonadales bacterium]|jgi:hypothetical protein|nr:hypothetical protein [Sphingomonadales bacterium]